MARLAGRRSPVADASHHRYERTAGHFPAFTSIASTLICRRRLTT